MQLPWRKQALGSGSTALEALRGADLSGRVAVVTGGNGGVGLETVRALAHAGADVLLCSRSLEAGRAAAEQLAADTAVPLKGTITAKPLDLADLASVKALAADLTASLPRLDLLVCNAGVMACPQGKTKDGFEMQLGTNHVGHCFLTQLLRPKLESTGAGARVVVVSSVAHKYGKIELEDLQFEAGRPYSPWDSYNQSKLANVLFAAELARQLKEAGSPVAAFSLHPGFIKSPLWRHSSWRSGWMEYLFQVLGAPFAKTVAQGAATSIYAATAPELEGQSGAYLADCKVTAPSKAARDAQLAKALWAKTEELLAAALQQRGLA